MQFIKAHAYGNDFLLLHADELPPSVDRAALAQRLCDRHHGLGADGLITFSRLDDTNVRMSLLNADGSYSEVSGNGVRCLAALLAMERGSTAGAAFEISTDAGVKCLELLERAGTTFRFRASMGMPQDVRRMKVDVDGNQIDVVALRVGNPQCVVLGDVTPERLHTIAAALAVHRSFPEGTNVELATVEAPDRVRILIWERGVGPTEASGTGACAAAVAAIEFGGAARGLDVVSPGGTQRVEWRHDGLFLTGDAEVTAICRWMGRPSGA